MLSKCAMCGHPGIEDTMEVIQHTLDGNTYTRLVPAEKCSGCGEVYYRAAVLQAFDIWVSRFLVENLGAEAEKFLRKLRKSREVNPALHKEATSDEYRQIWDNGN